MGETREGYGVATIGNNNAGRQYPGANHDPRATTDAEPLKKVIRVPVSLLPDFAFPHVGVGRGEASRRTHDALTSGR